MSRVLTPIDVRYEGGRTWKLLASFACISDTLGRIDMPSGSETDFNSIPRVLWSIFPPADHAVASLPHDELYKRGALNGRSVTRSEVDAVYREFLRYDGTPTWKEHAMYWGVRVGGWKPWNNYRKASHVETAR